MNKDKRAVVQVLADLCRAYSTQRTLPHKVLMIMRDAVKSLADSEQRSVKKMEPYKDSPGTAANYLNGVACWEDLTAAQDHLEDGDLAEAMTYLIRVATQDPPSKATPPAPAKTRRTKK